MSERAGPDERDPDQQEDESAARMHWVGYLGVPIAAERVIPTQEGEDGQELRVQYWMLVLGGGKICRKGLLGYTYHVPHQLNEHASQKEGLPRVCFWLTLTGFVQGPLSDKGGKRLEYQFHQDKQDDENAKHLILQPLVSTFLHEEGKSNKQCLRQVS